MTTQDAIRAELDQAEHEAEHAARHLTVAAAAAEAIRADVRGAVDREAARLARARAGARLLRASHEAQAADARLTAARGAVLSVTAATFAADLYDHEASGLGPVAVD